MKRLRRTIEGGVTLGKLAFRSLNGVLFMNTGIVGDIYRVACRGELFGQEVVHVTYWLQSTPNTSGISSRRQLSQFLANAWVGNLSPLQTPSFSIIDVTVTDVVPFGDTSGEDVFSDNPLPFAGTSTLTVTCPPATAVVGRKRTSLIGRKFRGRNYYTGIPIGSTSLGQLTNSGLTGWTAGVSAFIAPFNGFGGDNTPTFLPLIVGVLTTNEAGKPLTYRSTQVTSTDVDPILRQQRRREIGVGA